MLKKFENYIGGEFKSTSAYIDVFNPSTGQVYAQLPESDANDVDLAVKEANEAFKSWSKTSKEYRSELLLKIADAIQDQLDDFAMAESIDQGKPLSLAKSMDISRAIHNFRFFASSILHQPTMCDSTPQFLNYTLREPVGVVALISPWNLPLYLLTWKLAPCLASGCTAVCKPSEFTSATAYMLCKIFEKVNLPKGVINMVFGSGKQAGSMLVKHDLVKAISFTGGTVTGKYIYSAAAERNKKLSLELGGKNATIIFEDADFEKALETSLKSAFLNQGEICLCGSRIFVQEAIYEKFVKLFTLEASKMIVGDPLNQNTQLGALVSEDHLNKVLSYVELAKKEGGKVLTGGERIGSKGYFMRPTVIVNLHPTECRVQKEEIFGPVVTITPFTSVDQAIHFANATEYGLSASVWTQNLSRAHQIAKSLEVGTVWVNTWLARNLNMPFGGVKASGLGREGRDGSMEFFSEEKTVCIAT